MTNRTVLYIDDNDDNIRLVERVLKRSPEIELRTVATGREGIEAAIDDLPVLILLDNRLTDIDGEQVMRELIVRAGDRRDPGDHRKRRRRPGDDERSSRAGAVDYMVKPVDICLLMTVIERYLG